MHLFPCFLCLLVLMHRVFNSPLSEGIDSKSTADESFNETYRVYALRRCSGGGCPYAASWLSHINLYRQVTWWLDITKMEAASFSIFDKAQLKFQLSDPDAYYVHHLSMFEHLNHKKYGFEVAKNKTLVLSETAFSHECGNLTVSSQQHFLSLIAFYGGLPPGVTKDLSVKSIGQGNSLVDGNTKAIQTLATVCSCLKYFGSAVIGVARDEDRVLINEMIHQRLGPSVRHHINVIQLRMQKPANLPFHLLSWGQQYVRIHNCFRFYSTPLQQQMPSSASRLQHHRLLSTGSSPNSTRDRLQALPHRTYVASRSNGSAVTRNDSHSIVHHKGKQAWDAWNSIIRKRSINMEEVPVDDVVFDICRPNSIAASKGGPVDLVYMKKIDPWIFNADTADRNESGIKLIDGGINEGRKESTVRGKQRRPLVFVPKKFVYFTESDQIVRFDSWATLQALTAASNESTFFVGRRREKSRDTDPNDYMGSLNIMRQCGVTGYSLTWPLDPFVQKDP